MVSTGTQSSTIKLERMPWSVFQQSESTRKVCPLSTASYHTADRRRLTDRNQEISKPEEIEGWVGFNFPGRGQQYSSLKYHWSHFNGVDWDDSRQEKAVFKVNGPSKGWDSDVSNENGNYDYLMFANIDYSNPEVRDDVLNWGKWITTQLPLKGMRLDAVKHYSAAFQKTFVQQLRGCMGQDFFFVGEYWKGEVDILLKYLKNMDYQISLFDVPLLGRFSAISRTEGADLRRIFEGTLLQKCPEHAVVSCRTKQPHHV